MFITKVTLDNVPWYHEEFSRLDAERSANSSQNVFYLISSVAPTALCNCEPLVGPWLILLRGLVISLTRPPASPAGATPAGVFFFFHCNRPGITD